MGKKKSGAVKTFWCPNRSLGSYEYLARQSSQQDQDSCSALICAGMRQQALTLLSGVQVTAAALLCMRDGRFSDLLAVTLDDGRKLVVARPEAQVDYVGEISGYAAELAGDLSNLYGMI